jgi:hypothetical protein
MPADKANKKNGSSDTSAPTDTISFDEAVREGKEIVANAERGQWRLGELADSVEKKYGERKLAKFADAIGVAPCTLARYRDVYRKWKDICAPGRESMPPYAVLRELAQFATHPKCKQLIQDNPKITKREAYELRRKLKGDEEEKQEQQQEGEWLRDNRRWFRDLCTDAEKAARAANFAFQCPREKLHELLDVVDSLKLMNLGGHGRIVANLAEHLEALKKEKEQAEQAEQAEQEDAEASAPIVHPEASTQEAA